MQYLHQRSVAQGADIYSLFFDVALEWQTRKVLHSPPVFFLQRKVWRKPWYCLVKNSLLCATMFGSTKLGFQDFLGSSLTPRVDCK